MDGVPKEITTLVGREVYSNSGVFVGGVENVRLDLDHETITDLALMTLSNELFRNQIEPGKGVLIPYRWVRTVGDVILINDVIEHLKNSEENEESLVA